MDNYMKITYIASLMFIIGLMVLLVLAVVVAIKEAVIAHMEKKYGCEEVDEFEELETANEAYNRLFQQYEDLYDKNLRLEAENTTLARKCRRLGNTCDDLEAENTRLKAEREALPESTSETNEGYSDPKTWNFGHVETPNE